MGLAETFKAMGDPVRREMLELLKTGRKTAGEIAGHFDITAATVSYHLSQLKKAELVSESKYKNFVYYEINVSVLEEIMLWIRSIQGGTEHEDEEKNR